MIIHSSPTPIDRTWRATFKPDVDLRARAGREVWRVHEVLHSQASLFQMCMCGSCGPRKGTDDE